MTFIPPEIRSEPGTSGKGPVFFANLSVLCGIEQEVAYLRFLDLFDEANPNVHIPIITRDISLHL
jgi:hypothetical protein